MSGVAVGATLLAAGVSAYGAIQQGEAQSAAAKYSAAVANNNATIATQNATLATQAGEAQAALSEQKTRAAVGSIKAAQAANGLDVNSGSTVDVQSSAAAQGELNAITIRNNAARTAYGYQTQSQSFTAQAGLDKMEAQNAETAGYIGAGSALLNGTGKAAGYMNAGSGGSQ